ncbi:p53 apoptosis effector related to PMP-22 [Protopterus annectens]|uniref:p53 apoptosis effector related to PMP-22 n=1 Tax=Protopterus annectens TaxID=7888 RepID=UPI001CFB4649|nr:p53 apoptosis effector related to PMP-22 [Protopterus annectens]
MLKCGIAYPRCKWILPLLLLCAVIFDIIALAGSGWVESKRHYASLWQHCRGKNDVWGCFSLMDYAWARAAAALMIIGFIILLVCFFMSFVALCSPNFPLMRLIGALLILAAVIQFIGLIVYAVNFTSNMVTEGSYEYSWSYGFGWGSTILMIGCTIFFCCLPNYEDKFLGNEKISYIF